MTNGPVSVKEVASRATVVYRVKLVPSVERRILIPVGAAPVVGSGLVQVSRICGPGGPEPSGPARFERGGGAAVAAGNSPYTEKFANVPISTRPLLTARVVNLFPWSNTS